MNTQATGNDLFINLVQQFRSYTDAAVLWVLLKERADVGEISITSGSITDVELCRTIPLPTVKRTLQRLQETGFINVRVQKNTKTLVTVNKDAVLALLRQPVSERLPSVSKKQFPFLETWNEDIAQKAAHAANEYASAGEGGNAGEAQQLDK